MKKCIIFLLLIFAYASPVYSQHSFKVIPLGVKGGIDESDLSSYMLAAVGSDNYICLDAGTLHVGIQKAVESGLFTNNSAQVLRTNVKGYLISHPHLDHVAGLIINSPDDSAKAIYALPFCIDVLKNNYFTWKSWANFANEGDKPTLNKYHYVSLVAEQEIGIENTELSVTAFPLSHSNPGQSTAFLIRHNDAYCLYLGDSGADTLERTNNLYLLWKAIAPLVKSKKLKAIFIEVSFPNQQPEKLLFGHLTPKLLIQEMRVLGAVAGNDAIKGLPVVITHIKPNGNNEAQIKKQVNEMNSLELKISFPEQAKLLEF